MKKNKILIVYPWEYPWDIRVDKIVGTLITNNYEVHIFAANKFNKAIKEQQGTIFIHRFRYYTKNNRINQLMHYPCFLNIIWFIQIYKIIKEINPDCVIVRDLLLSFNVLFITKILKISSILDNAENFPAWVKFGQTVKKNFIFKIFIDYLNIYKYIEKFSLNNCDKCFVVVDEAKERLINDYSINKEKIIVISNTPPLPDFEKSKHFSSDKLNVLYVGNIDGEFRGLDTVIDAAKVLCNYPVKFTIIGDGILREVLEKKVKTYGLNNILLKGRIEHDKLKIEFDNCDVGIVPHLANDVINYTIPNKLFDYMSYSLPVIVSSAKPLKRIVEEENCGYVFEAGNSNDLAETILLILKNKNDLYQKGENGRQAIIKKYNWGNDQKKMLSVIEGLIKG